MAESRAILSTEELERFLAGRAPVAAPPRLADEVMAGVVDLPQARRGWVLPGLGGVMPMRGTLAPVAAVVALALVLGLLALASAARLPQPVVPAQTWVRTSLGDPGSTATVIGAGAGYVFAASSPDDASYADRVWRSTDGAAWAPIADQTPFAGARIGGFLEVGHSVLAYGSRTDAAGNASIATWASDDGATWRLLSDAGSTNPLDGQQREHLDAVVAGGPGFVGVGTTKGTAFHGPAAWTSTDGVAWTRTSALDGTGVVGLVRAKGGFLALTWSDRIIAWTSPDGATWSRGTFPDTVPCCGYGAMANLPGGMPLGAIAVIPGGAGDALKPSAFVTRDAETWTPLVLPPPPCVTTTSRKTCPLIATAVAADAGHVVVAGSTSATQTGPFQMVFWTSADGGQTWTVSAEPSPLALDPAQPNRPQDGIVGLWAGGPNAFFAVGRTQTDGASVWTGHPFPPPAP